METHNSLNQLLRREGGNVLPIRGTASEPLAGATVNGAPATVRGGTSFEGTASVTPGSNTVTVAATDQSGNTSTRQYQVAVTNGSSRTLTYDFNGNLTNDGNRTFEWDALNRLAAVTQGTHRSEFSYDGFGRRVKIVEKENGVLQSERRYVWDGLEPAEERTDSGTVTRRYYGEGVLLYQPSGGALQASYTYTRDHLGSVRELCDATGAAQVRYDYDPYGRRTVTYRNGAAPDADVGYTGHFHHNPTNLALAPYRAYDPDLGRWLSRDPVEDAELLEGPNLYGYVLNDPVNYLDPTGLGRIGWTFELVDLIPNILRKTKKAEKVSKADAIDAAKCGQDVMAPNMKEGYDVAKGASGPGKEPIYEPGRGGHQNHYHPNPRTGSHIWWYLVPTFLGGELSADQFTDMFTPKGDVKEIWEFCVGD